MKDLVERYFSALKRTPLDEKTEHTDRGALETLLQAFAARQNKHNLVVHEPGRQGDKGAPDFKVRQAGQIVGYVENKKIDDDLNRVAKGEQIARYAKLSNNILLTDYLNFVWIQNGKISQRASLGGSEELLKRGDPAHARIAEVSALLEAYFSTAPEGIGRSQQLALALATRSRLLRDYLTEELIRQRKDHSEGRLFGLYQVFKTQVFHDLTLVEFADAFAQMLAYGLFLARLNSGKETVTLENARQYVPHAFELIRELVDFLGELQKPEYREVRWVVEEVLSIVNGLDLAAIHEDLSFRQRRAISRRVRAGDEEEHRLFERDPFIYFYEDFLKAYDPETRKSRGVYYTPPPVVNFIVRAIDDILKDPAIFNLPDGLADSKNVTVLDFACGTGTFLLEVFQRVFETIGGPDAGIADPIVRQHLLRNIFGFEYLIAPYTIAHLKLSQYLQEQRHPLREGERLQVFLTNTLEPIAPQKNFLLPAVTAEVEAAQRVKDREILVITGNPPYSGHSKNKGEWITRAIDGYKHTIEKDAAGNEHEKPLGETNAKWLNDDYVKFIRFAQMKMDDAPEGIVGIITNHSWLDNPTFRGMRQSLARSFEQIFVLDLHGSIKPKEVAPVGVENENVFDIQKGVAITILVKRPGADRGLNFAEVWGNRLQKYEMTAGTNLRQIEWLRPQAVAPYYMFRPLDWENWDEYEQGWPVADTLNREGQEQQIFAVNVLGFQTHRDDFAIAFDEEEMERRVRNLRDSSISDQTIREAHGLKDNQDWKLHQVREALKANDDWQGALVPCAYRPFDVRACLFGYELMDRPRRELIEHVAYRDNLLLLIPRQISTAQWRHASVANVVAESCYISDGTTEQNYCFPAWLYNSGGPPTENLSETFRAYIDAKYAHHYTPEEIFGYIYAVLHAPTYRKRYAEFLRIDFPRIRFPEKSADFEALSKLGWTMVQAHLLKGVPRKKLAQFHGQGDQAVERVGYAETDRSIVINKTQRFAPVPAEIWNFHIGGYQVLDKYLKSRKGRTLTLDEINHVSAIADSLAFTIEQMAKIDEAYKAAFPAGG